MSFKAMAWASKQKTGNSTRKLILLLLADRANDEGFCWPSMSTVAEDCELTREAVSRNIKVLEKKGFLKIVRRKKDGVNLPNQYYLNMDIGVVYGEGGVPYENHNGSDLKSHKPINEPVSNNINRQSKDYPENLNMEAFRLWCEYKGKRYTKKGKTLSANKLAKFPKDVQMKMVENSIINNYAGLFDITSKKEKTGGPDWYDSPEYQ